MTYQFSQKSEEKLTTCHPDIQKICRVAIRYYDFAVIEGHRTLETQQAYFAAGKSKKDGIKNRSKHQDLPSMAVDILPVKEGTNAFSGHEKDSRRFYFLMGVIRAVSERLYEAGQITHRVRFGLDWDGDDTYRDQTFDDLSHFELIP